MKTNPSADFNYKPPKNQSERTISGVSGNLHDLPDAVIQTDINFKIKGWNAAAGELHGLPGAMGKNLFSLIKIELINSSVEQMKQALVEKKCWQGEVKFRRFNGEVFYFNTTANFLMDEEGRTDTITIVCHDITHSKLKEEKFSETEETYKKLVNTLIDGVIMFDAKGMINACNKRATEIFSVAEEKLIGSVFSPENLKAIKRNGSKFPYEEFPSVVSQQTGFPQRNVKMGIYQPDGNLVWLSVNSEALIRKGEFEPYAVVLSFSDITERLFREEELRKSNERFFYITRLTTDAIWDLDLESNEIYRSEAFCELSGYSQEEISSNLDWWFEKIHQDDRERVKNKVSDYLSGKQEKWEDEYRFLCADGNYRHLSDTGIILYKNQKPVRILGAIRDLTERKKLEDQLIFQKGKEQRAIELAAINAQERERNKISSELHDNVNQILTSARLFMDAAKKEFPGQSDNLDKAMEYQHLAIEEIRRLSHELNSSLVNVLGLQRSINGILRNMETLYNCSGAIDFDSRLENMLTPEQKLTIYRVIQEQTSNIIKHSEASSVRISLNTSEENILLTIVDNGKGFDPKTTTNGIGLVNIFNRVKTFNGCAEIHSSKGKGCKLEINLPLEK